MGDSAGTPRRDPEGDDVRTRLVALSRDWADAIVSNDVTRIGGFMAEEWVIVSASGVSTREEFLSLVASGRLRHSAMTAIGRPRIRVHGAAAVLTARVTNTARYLGERFDADEWTTDVFVERDGRWLCVLSHVTAAAPDPDRDPGPARTMAPQGAAHGVTPSGCRSGAGCRRGRAA